MLRRSRRYLCDATDALPSIPLNREAAPNRAPYLIPGRLEAHAARRFPWFCLSAVIDTSGSGKATTTANIPTVADLETVLAPMLLGGTDLLTLTASHPLKGGDDKAAANTAHFLNVVKSAKRIADKYDVPLLVESKSGGPLEQKLGTWAFLSAGREAKVMNLRTFFDNAGMRSAVVGFRLEKSNAKELPFPKDADLLVVDPVFGAGGDDSPTSVGLAGLREVVKNCCDKPVVAAGGITTGTIHDVMGTSVAGIQLSLDEVMEILRSTKGSADLTVIHTDEFLRSVGLDYKARMKAAADRYRRLRLDDPNLRNKAKLPDKWKNLFNAKGTINEAREAAMKAAAEKRKKEEGVADRRQQSTHHEQREEERLWDETTKHLHQTARRF